MTLWSKCSLGDAGRGARDPGCTHADTILILPKRPITFEGHLRHPTHGGLTAGLYRFPHKYVHRDKFLDMENSHTSIVSLYSQRGETTREKGRDGREGGVRPAISDHSVCVCVHALH